LDCIAALVTDQSAKKTILELSQKFLFKKTTLSISNSKLTVQGHTVAKLVEALGHRDKN
jgi:hypothetical protein